MGNSASTATGLTGITSGRPGRGRPFGGGGPNFTVPSTTIPLLTIKDG